MFAKRHRRQGFKYKVVTAFLYGLWKFNYRFEKLSEAIEFAKGCTQEWKIIDTEGKVLDCSLNYKN